VRISGSEDVYVTSNRRQLLLALGNLVLNSLQAFNSDRRHDLFINWNNNNGYVNLCLRDNGCGIPADELESIFELFFTARKDNDSCGIGLATARKIIEMYGGLIKVSSQFGDWTRFDIRLRAAMANHNE
jgi:signal transduction histidine kinase